MFNIFFWKQNMYMLNLFLFQYSQHQIAGSIGTITWFMFHLFKDSLV